jgi:hypothetical protein
VRAPTGVGNTGRLFGFCENSHRRSGPGTTAAIAAFFSDAEFIAKGQSMTKTLHAALVAVALGGATLITAAPTMAADNVTVAVSPGGIAFGYNDGYWDRGHNWHAWKNREEAARFQKENRDHYFDYKHDRDRDAGWRESDRYWERR